jgi:hypothetical protein
VGSSTIRRAPKSFDIKIIDTKIAGISTAHNSSRVLLLFTQITPKLSIYT